MLLVMVVLRDLHLHGDPLPMPVPVLRNTTKEVLVCGAVLLFGGVRIAGQARDRLGQLLAVGVAALFFCHVFINIGMNIRLTPVTGIPLPLLSYGGTSVLCSLIAIGLLQNVYRARHK